MQQIAYLQKSSLLIFNASKGVQHINWRLASQIMYSKIAIVIWQ